MVWSVKYRRKILNSEIEEYLKELVQQIAEDKGFTVHLFECGEGSLLLAIGALWCIFCLGDLMFILEGLD